MIHDALVPIYCPADLLEGDAIRQALQHEGIACHLDGENVACLVPFPNIGPIRLRLLVRAPDAERAKTIIEEGEGRWPTYT